MFSFLLKYSCHFGCYSFVSCVLLCSTALRYTERSRLSVCDDTIQQGYKVQPLNDHKVQLTPLSNSSKKTEHYNPHKVRIYCRAVVLDCNSFTSVWRCLEPIPKMGLGVNPGVQNKADPNSILSLLYSSRLWWTKHRSVAVLLSSLRQPAFHFI